LSHQQQILAGEGWVRGGIVACYKTKRYELENKNGKVKTRVQAFSQEKKSTV
jgi:hypothetical protein